MWNLIPVQFGLVSSILFALAISFDVNLWIDPLGRGVIHVGNPSTKQFVDGRARETSVQ